MVSAFRRFHGSCLGTLDGAATYPDACPRCALSTRHAIKPAPPASVGSSGAIVPRQSTALRLRIVTARHFFPLKVFVANFSFAAKGEPKAWPRYAKVRVVAKQLRCPVFLYYWVADDYSVPILHCMTCNARITGPAGFGRSQQRPVPDPVLGLSVCSSASQH